jgi:hypothetical protein
MDSLPPTPITAQAPAPVFECVRWSWSSDRLTVWCLQWREKGKPTPQKLSEVQSD